MSILESGQQLSARYTARERLSEGALGETWRALDARGNRPVVLKVLRPELTATAGAVASLNAEFEAASRVQHPSFARDYEIERDGDLVYLVREFVPGTDLSSLRGQPWRQVVPAVLQVADALAVLHAAGLVHRDIKSSNVILRPDGSVCVIDLGAAALSGDAAAATVGSPYSQSPQQLSREPPTPGDDLYALGVLLYELLSGYPPFYPDISAERVTGEAPLPVRAVHTAPGALTELVMALLAKDPAARPQSMVVVAEQLRSMLADAGPAEDVPAAEAGQRPKVAIIRPIVRPAEKAADAKAAPVSWRRKVAVGAGIVAGVAVLVGVFVALPRLAPEVEVKPRTPVSRTPAVNEPAPAAPVDYEQLAIEMDRAEQARGAYTSLLASLEKRGAGQWAAAPLAAGKAKGEEAQRQFSAREYEAARESWKAGLDHLQQASDEAVKVLNAALERGANALAAGQSKVAHDAFTLALQVDADNQVAKKGLKRADSLDKVVAQLNAAANAERDMSWATAENHFRQALALDPETQAATEGIARMKQRIASDEFAAAMSAGFAALNAGRLGEARSIFQRAGGIRPNTPEVTDALAQVALAEKRLQIAAHRQKAESFEKSERWAEAVTEYDAALKLDPALEFALQGRARAVPRAALHRELDLLVKNPDRLLTPAVRQQARALLAAAAKVSEPGSILREQVERVGTSLAQAEKPVRVALESDNATQIAINRVGALGTFDRREVELSPGRYTVVGTRAGYRDVRRELTILPGQAPAPVVIRCEEPI
jgi:tetratricopeptide (TPR) repeat protein